MKFGKQYLLGWIVLTIGIFSSGCSEYPPAPVTNAWLQISAKTADYRVRSGDTIYSIAWEFGIDYAALAAANHLSPPYRIYTGQRLKMTTIARGHYLSRSPIVTVQKIVNNFLIKWHWPAQGRVVEKFSSQLGKNQGLNIAGKFNSSIYAAMAGKIVYNGNGVRGYGNLIIIKHNRHYLSAYAYNERSLVKLGQQVQSGEQIATMGCDDIGRVLLHFEIRRDGQAIDPINLLK